MQKLLLRSLFIFFFTKRHPWLPKGHTTLFRLVILPLAPLASYFASFITFIELMNPQSNFIIQLNNVTKH